MNNEHLVEYLKKLCKEKGIKQSDFLADMELNKDYFYTLKNKKSPPKFEQLQKMEDYFELPSNTLSTLQFDGIPNDFVTIDHIATVAAGFDKIADIDIMERVVVPSAWLRGYPASECKIVTVNGDSMHPSFQNLDRVIFHIQPSIPSGSIGIVQYNGDEITLKRIVYSPNSDYFDMVPINPIYPTKRIQGNEELSKCRVLGLVIYLIREI